MLESGCGARRTLLWVDYDICKLTRVKNQRRRLRAGTDRPSAEHEVNNVNTNINIAHIRVN